MSTYDFKTDLQFSLGEREKVDIDVLKSIIPNCVQVTKTDVADDRLGVDYIATLDHGAEIYIDAKARRAGCKKFWPAGIPRLALETWSAKPTKENPNGKVGWTVSRSTKCDMILYTFDKEDTDLFYLFPYQHLRMAFQKHCREWMKDYPLKRQNNGSYTSEAMFVPAPLIIQAMSEQMTHVAEGVTT